MMRKPILILAGLLVLLAALSAKAGRRESRGIVYNTPSQVVSASLGETVMATAAKEGTYRFGVSIETQPGDCEEDTVPYFVRSYVNTKGLSAGQRTEIKIRKKGSTVTSTAEIPTAVFHVRAGSRISYHIEYMIGGRCKVRPTYKIFPLLEQAGR